MVTVLLLSAHTSAGCGFLFLLYAPVATTLYDCAAAGDFGFTGLPSCYETCSWRGCAFMPTRPEHPQQAAFSGIAMQPCRSTRIGHSKMQTEVGRRTLGDGENSSQLLKSRHPNRAGNHRRVTIRVFECRLSGSYSLLRIRTVAVLDGLIM